jgi:sugar phosphate isomerase/epimerase
MNSGELPVAIEPEWVNKVIHVHVHDVDNDGLDHYRWCGESPI